MKFLTCLFTCDLHDVASWQKIKFSDIWGMGDLSAISNKHVSWKITTDFENRLFHLLSVNACDFYVRFM